MLIFKDNENQHYVFIHIPKCCGTYIREQIMSNPNYSICKKYWDHESTGSDLAHIPYMYRDNYIDKDINYNFVAFTRNPYHRFISAYNNRLAHIKEHYNDSQITFKSFILTKLTTIFNENDDGRVVHFYPQYLFVINKQHFPECKTYKLETYNDEIIPLNDFYIKPYWLSQYFDNETLAVFNKFYEKDFIYFNYEMIHTI